MVGTVLTVISPTAMRRARRSIAGGLLVLAGCTSDGAASPVSVAPIPETEASVDTTPDTTPDTTTGGTIPITQSTADASTFTAEVWADNWFSLSVNGELVGEDSVAITTERSFNAETLTFSASYPLTIAIVAKDYKETDSGLEYIGTDRQQMGDGGLIAQFTDTSTGQVVATTTSEWRGSVIHTAPTNPECVDSADPDADCASVILDEPAGWTEPGYDDSAWTPATVYTAEQVGAKDGYTEVVWDAEASLIWATSLTQHNTILWRTVITAP